LYTPLSIYSYSFITITKLVHIFTNAIRKALTVTNTVMPKKIMI